MAEVVFDGVGVPVNDPNIVGAEANLVPGLVIFPRGGAILGGINIVINNPNVYITGHGTPRFSNG